MSPQLELQVLIIDDDLAFAKIVEKRLKSFLPEMVCTHCDNLTKARAYINKQLELGPLKLDLVVIDEHLPDGRGNEMIAEGHFENLAVLSVSSDDAPELPGTIMQSGAMYFLSKSSVSEPLFKPLVRGLIERNKLSRELAHVKSNALILDTVKTLVGTLRHEINNPLGAVLGAAYLLRNSENATQEQKEAADLVESSGKRIKHVMDQLCKAIAVDAINKANHKVFHIPGDDPWENKK